VFTLAHLSDPHLAPLPQPRWHELLGKRATGYLNWRRRRHRLHRSDVLARIVADLKQQETDHIAVTGDLVNIALASEYQPAREFLTSLGSAGDVTLVPGNHDAYVRGGIRYCDQHWVEYMRGDHEIAFPFLRRRGPLALIGLSSAVPTAPFMATGRLGHQQIARLGELLDRCEDAFRIVLIHHPPINKPSRHFKRLLDGVEFRNALSRHGAELVIHGHDHEHSVMFLEGPHRRIPAVGVPSASHAVDGKHHPGGYNLYRVEGSNGAWRCEVVSRGLAHDGGTVIETGRAEL
jgi:3',5'-cyclic AMP phosphodiesterase CpdA